MSSEEAHRRRQAVSSIHDIVGALRAIAAGRIQGAQRAQSAATRYRQTVERALQIAAADLTAAQFPDVRGRPPLVIVLTSEQPLCGGFNQNVLAFAERRWHELRRLGGAKLVVVGRRGIRQLGLRGVIPDVSEPAMTSLPGLRDLVKRLAQLVDRLYAAGEIGEVRVIYNRYESVSEQVPSEELILPLDLTRLRQSAAGPARPISHHRYLSKAALLAGLVSESVFIGLYQSAADSFASEQASRLVAMDGATRNTEKMLQQLLDQERHERQGQITRQVLEQIAARFALR